MPQLQIILAEDSQHTHELAEEKTTLGRVEDNIIPIDHDSVSSHHAEITFDGSLYHLHDLGSTNGTFVNGEQVTDSILNNGDEIRFGAVNAVFTGPAKASRDAQPLPASSALSHQAGSQSSRPESFVCSSPVPKNVKTKDPTGVAAMAVGILSLLAVVVVASMALMMQA